MYSLLCVLAVRESYEERTEMSEREMHFSTSRIRIRKLVPNLSLYLSLGSTRISSAYTMTLKVSLPLLSLVSEP